MKRAKKAKAIDGIEVNHEGHFKKCGCWLKTFWSLSVSAILGVFMYVGVLLLLKYKAENTRVACQIKPVEAPFPMVTLCNKNPYKASATVRFPDLAHLIERYDQITTSSDRHTKEGVPVGGIDQRRKRDASPCKCNFDNPLTVTSNDGERTFVLYPKMITNWSCGFACCAQSGEGDDRRLARPTKEDVPLLQVGGMLAKWILIGMHCSDSASCKWYDDPNTPSSSTVTIMNACDSCTLVGISPVGNVALNYYNSGSGTSAYRMTKVSDKDTAAPLCQVRAVPPASNMIRDQLTTTDKLATTDGLASSYTSAKQVKITTKRTNTEQYRDQSNINLASTVSAASTFESTQHTITSREITTTAASLASSIFPSSAEQNNSTTNHVIEQYLDESKTDHLSLSAVARDMVPYVTSPVDLEERILAGYDPEEVIIRCAYNGYKCSYRNFTTIVDPNYGNCYAFNLDGRYGTTRKPGAGGTGLSVSYAVGTHEYLSFIESTGIRVIVSEQDKPIFPDAEGFDVMSGYRTSVSLRATALRALSTRRKPCFSKGDDLDPYYYEEKKYSTEACLRSCYQRQVIEKCQCGDPRIPIPDNVTYCPLTNRHCVNENYEVADGEQCNCPRECSIDEYDMAITKSKFSTSRITEQSTGHTADALDVDVYLASSIALECREELAYTIGMFCWDLANDIVTFTGVSAIYVIVVMKAIYQRAANVIRKMKDDPEEEPDVAPEANASQMGRDDSVSVQSL